MASSKVDEAFEVRNTKKSGKGSDENPEKLKKK